MATFTRINRDNGNVETVTVPQDKAGILLAFEDAPNDHWLWFHLAKWVQQNGPEAQSKSASLKMTIAFLADSFLLAQGMGLKAPMIRLHYKGQRFKVSLSKPKAPSRWNARGSKGGAIRFDTGDLAPIVDALPGSPVRWSSDPVGDERYLASLFGGKLFLAKDGFGRDAREKPLTPTEREVLDGLTQDAPGFLARAGKDMDRCCYCGKPLEDSRSKEVGYGAICAERWGLPWGVSADEKVPSFADLWGRANPNDQRSIRWICGSIRAEASKDNPDESLLSDLWRFLGDALLDAGWQGKKLPQMPARGVMLCRS